jgi:hypothetical protein
MKNQFLHSIIFSQVFNVLHSYNEKYKFNVIKAIHKVLPLHNKVMDQNIPFGKHAYCTSEDHAVLNAAH